MKQRYLECFLFTIFLSFISSDAICQVKISKMLYAQNHWLANGDENNRPGYINLLWPKVKESGVKLIRIGGNGYLRMPERDRLNTMVDSIQNIGAEPLMQIPRTFTKEQVIELVRYYNKSDRKPIKFWCIGNEPLHKHHNLKIEQVYDYIMKISPAIREADKNVKIFVFDEAEMMESAYRRLCGGDLDVCGKDKNGNWLVDGFSFHSYPNGRDFDRNDVIFTGPKKIERQIVSLLKLTQKANKKHNRKGENQLIWGLTEVNVTYHNPDRDIRGFGNTSFLGGQFIAEIYGLGAKYGAFTVAPWCINESDRVHTDFGYIGAPEEFFPRSSFYHTQMMSRYICGDFINSHSNQGYVKTIASKNNGYIALMIMNQDDLRGYEYEVSSQKDIGTSPLLISLDTNVNLNYKGTIPSQSTLLLVFSMNGEMMKKIIYSMENNLNNEPPLEDCLK